MTCKTATWIAIPAGILLAGIALWWSPLNQDEGWYLMSAQRVSQGQLPYLDFAFTQPPVFPTVYRLASPLVSWAGIAGARGFTFLFGVAGLGLLVHTVRRVCPAFCVPLGTLFLILLLGLNPGYLQFITTVKTYALAGFFLSAALCLRMFAQQRPSPVTFFLCGMCCALAAGTRISLIVFPIPLFIELILNRRDLGLNASLWFATGVSATLLALFSPFLAVAPEGLFFGLWEYHTGRDVDNTLIVRGAFLIRWIRTILPTVLVLALLWPKRKRFLPVSKAFLVGALLVTLVHLTAPFPYDEYQTVLLPVLVLVIALEAPRALPGNLRRKAPVWMLLFTLLFAGTSPVIETWFGGQRDRLWWPANLRSDLYALKEAAAVLDIHDPNGTLLFTTDTYLAIEAGRDVPSGLEMGPFSYFPDMPTARAERLHVINTEILFALIEETDATSAAFSGYGFSISSPSLTPTPEEELSEIYEAIASRFHYTESWPVGQAGTTLKIFIRQ